MPDPMIATPRATTRVVAWTVSVDVGDDRHAAVVRRVGVAVPLQAIGPARRSASRRRCTASASRCRAIAATMLRMTLRVEETDTAAAPVPIEIETDGRYDVTLGGVGRR